MKQHASGEAYSPDLRDAWCLCRDASECRETRAREEYELLLVWKGHCRLASCAVTRRSLNVDVSSVVE